MATGHENLDEMSKDELILESNRPSTSKVDSELSILNALSSLQGSMDSMAMGISKMGQAWTSLAQTNSVKDQNTSNNLKKKRKAEDTESDSDSDVSDSVLYDDDVYSLINGLSKKEVEKEENADDEDQWLDEIDQSLENDDDIGPDTNPKLANIANKAFSKLTSGEIIKKKKSTYKRPKNCEKVVVPRINKEIWRRMKIGFMKKRDMKMTQIQTCITKSAFAVMQVAQYILKQDKAVEGKEDAVRACTDILCLLGDACTSMSYRRRELLRPVLKSDHAGLCDTNVPVTSLLFGDDLSKTLKESREANRLGRDPYHSKNWKRMGYRSQYAQNNEKQDKQSFKKKQRKM